MNRSDEVERYQETNVLEFFQHIFRTYAARFRRQNVGLNLDVDPLLWSEIPRRRVRDILESFIEDAFRAMPDGGVLDVTVVDGRHGLEIEVADSGELGGCDEEQVRRFAVWMPPQVTRRLPTTAGLRVETAVCPQGGLARTVIVPRRDVRDSRRAA